MKKNKFVFPILLFLLIIFLPATIYGVNKHNSLILDRDNPKHLPKKNNKLYFYDENDTLLGIYECQDKQNCDVAVSMIDDNNNLHYEGDSTKLPIYNNDYVFIQDGNKVLYYSLSLKKEIQTMNIIKNYGIGLEGGLLIYQNEFLNYGLLDPVTGVSIIEPNYTYMGLIGTLKDGKISTDKIIVQKDGSYYLINEEQDILSARLSDSIYSFDDSYIYMNTDLGNISIIDYQGNKILPEDFRKIEVLDNCVATITTDYIVRIYSKDYQILYYDTYYGTENVIFEEKGSSLTVTNNDTNKSERVSLRENNEEDFFS